MLDFLTTHLIASCWQFSGIVEEIGQSDTSEQSKESPAILSVGDRVMGVTRFGAFTSHINASVISTAFPFIAHTAVLCKLA